MPLAARAAPIGAHVSVAGGLSRALARADAVGAEAIQLFVANPRAWASPEADPLGDEAFRQACEQRRLPVFVHAPYLINFGSPDARTLTESARALGFRCGAAPRSERHGVVVHAGWAVGGVRRAGAASGARTAAPGARQRVGSIQRFRRCRWHLSSPPQAVSAHSRPTRPPCRASRRVGPRRAGGRVPGHLSHARRRTRPRLARRSPAPCAPSPALRGGGGCGSSMSTTAAIRRARVATDTRQSARARSGGTRSAHCSRSPGSPRPARRRDRRVRPGGRHRHSQVTARRRASDRPALARLRAVLGAVRV